MNKKQMLTIGSIGLIIIVVIALLIWLKPAPTTTPQSTTAAASPSEALSTQQSSAVLPATNNTTSLPQTAETLAASLHGTEIDCALSVDGAGQLILDDSIRPCYEYFLTQIGEKTLSVIDQQIQQYLAQLLPATAAQQAIDLWQRYLKYREAEGSLKVNSSTSDPDHLKQVFNTLYQLRQQYFSPVELEALFGDEMTYNQYTIDRVDIMQNKALSSTEKARQLKERFAQLPPDLQKNLSDISKLQDLRELTQQIKQRNGSPAELRQMRENLVGAAAADRLEQLDQQRNTWQNRVDTYLDQRAAILNSGQAAPDQQAAIIALRNRLFTTEAERQRAITFEHFKDQNINTGQLTQ